MGEPERQPKREQPVPPMTALREQAQRYAAEGRWSEASALLRGRADDVRHHPECAVLLGEALMRSGRAREARDWLADVLPVMAGQEDRPSHRRAVLLAGAASFELGELEAARVAFGEALDLGRAHRDDLLVARATNNLALIANVRGQWGEALALFNLAVSAYQRLGNVRGLAECFHNMAITQRDLGYLEASDELERRCVEFARESATPRLASHARLGRAELALRRGDPSLAEAAARRVAREFAEIGDPQREAESLRLAGAACTATGKFAEARVLLDDALSRTRELGAVLDEAEILRARAELLAASGARSAALDDATAALALFERLEAHQECVAMQRFIAALFAARRPAED